MCSSIKSWCETWLQAKAIEAEESTHARYKRVVEGFTGFLGEAKSNRDLSTLQASDIAQAETHVRVLYSAVTRFSMILIS